MSDLVLPPLPGTYYPDPVDYSAVMLYESDNNKTIALAEIGQMGFASQQALVDLQMQLASSTELALEGLDTKLQTLKLEYTQQMTAEENSHVERLAEAQVQLQELQSTYSLGADLPPPVEEEDWSLDMSSYF